MTTKPFYAERKVIPRIIHQAVFGKIVGMLLFVSFDKIEFKKKKRKKRSDQQ